MLTAEQIAARASGLGGSDSAAACGLSKWKSPLALWLEKLGRRTVVENEAMRWGSRLEPIVRQEYCDRTGRVVITPNEVLRHEQYPVLLANLDGLTEGRDRVVEIKTARTAEGWGEEGSGDIPIDYLLQVQHYMLVTAIPVADVAVLIGGSDFRIYEVPEDGELQAMLVETELAFWELVESETPPEPETLDDIKLRWPQSTARQVVADEETREIVRKAMLARETATLVDGDYEWLIGKLQTNLADADTLVDSSGKILATWKTAKAPQRFDTDAFKAAHPNLYQEFLRPGTPSRRFLLKGTKE